MRRAFFFGRQRTPAQDVEYSIDQLVEVALRALSPGINDPFTAITCIEWLGAALIRLGDRQFPARFRRDENGELRVIADVTDFAGLAASALDQIRQYGSSSVAVTLRMLDILERVGSEIRAPESREILRAHAQKIRDDGIASAGNAADRGEIEERFAAAESALRKGKA